MSSAALLQRSTVAPEFMAECAARPGSGCEWGDPMSFPDRSGLVGPIAVHFCGGCGQGVTRPPLPNVEFLYDDRSSQDFQGGAGRFARMIKAFVFGQEARRLLAQLPSPPRRVVDYGCGSGLFTRRLGDVLAPGGEVTGVDFHAEPPSELRGRPYRAASRTADLQGAADLLLAMHVLEHDDDPHTLLSRMLKLSAPGGHVVVEVPNVDCAWGRIFGRFWDAWYVPYHRVHFSRRSLRALVEANGLTILREFDVTVPTMGRTLANLLGRPNSLLFILLGAALHPLQWGLERATRRPTSLRIIARRP
jgi:trans-aconitate methyltransferase